MAQKRKGPRVIVIGPLERSGSGFQWLKRQIKALKLSRRDVLIAVDGGVDSCFKLGCVPDLAVGDWDSLKSMSSLKRVDDVLTLSTDKDRSDLYFALKQVERGANEMILLGVSGGRMDHHLAMMCDVFQALQSSQWSSVRVLSPECEIYFLNDRIKHWVGTLRRDQVVSLIPWGESAHGVRTSGLKFALQGALLAPSSHGLSNAALGKRCSVTISKGNLLVVIPSQP